MVKKIFISLSVVLLLSFASCGGGSSKEAKALLQKILTVVGFPPEAIDNICQTSNHSDICEGMTLHKVENGKNKTWQKIKETGEGQYLLETDTPCEPILLKLQDDDVSYDGGEFILKFSGVEYGQTTKELSILEAMVDALYISSNSVSNIKKLNSTDAQNSFYATLYKDLKTNINTLRAKNLTRTQAIRGTIKEMAEELLSYGINQTLPTSLNNCNDDTECIKKELDNLSLKLIIDNNESPEIYNAQKDNSESLHVREVSCEEPKKSINKFLNKSITYNDDGTKTWEGSYTYEDNRLKEWNWKDFDENGSSETWSYEYSQNKIKVTSISNEWYWEQLLENGLVKETNWYYTGNGLTWSQKVLEYDSQNRAIKVEHDYGDKNLDVKSIQTYEYDGEYLIHSEDIDQDVKYYDTTEYFDYKYDRSHKCITWESITGQVSKFFLDEDVCMNWTSKKVTTRRDNSSYTETQEITYNSNGLPQRIDSFEHDSENQKNKHTYTIFEYND